MRGPSARMGPAERATQASVRSTLTLNYKLRLKSLFRVVINKSLDGFTPGFVPSEKVPVFSVVDTLVKKRWSSLLTSGKTTVADVETTIANLIEEANKDIAQCEAILAQHSGGKVPTPNRAGGKKGDTGDSDDEEDDEDEHAAKAAG